MDTTSYDAMHTPDPDRVEDFDDAGIDIPRTLMKLFIFTSSFNTSHIWLASTIQCGDESKIAPRLGTNRTHFVDRPKLNGLLCAC